MDMHIQLIFYQNDKDPIISNGKHFIEQRNFKKTCQTQENAFLLRKTMI